MTGLGALGKKRGWIWVGCMGRSFVPGRREVHLSVRAFALLPASGAYTAYAARALHLMGSVTVVPLLLDLRVLRRAEDAG